MNRRNDIAIKREEIGWQDQRGGSFQELAYERPGTRIVLERQFTRIAEALQLKLDLRILDLGCGVGNLLTWLANRFPGKYHGLDISLNSALRARGTNPSLGMAVGDSESLPYKSGSFDRIVCNGSAHHFLNLRTALAEMHRVLAPGGILVLFEPTSSAFTNAIRSLVFWSAKYESPADLAHKEEFTPRLVRSTLAETGFGGISASFHDFLAYPLSGNYLKSPLGRSKTLMRFFSRLEDQLERRSALKRFVDLFAWRLLAVATKK